MKKNHISRGTISCSLNPDIVEILDYVKEQEFIRTRSHLIEVIFLDWLEEKEYLTHRDRLLLENCYREDLNNEQV